MSNIETYLAYLAGDYVGELPQPNPIRVELYLACCCELIDKADLPAPRPIAVEQYLYSMAQNGIGGNLPELANPATVAQIIEGYEAIDQDGAMLTGMMPDPEPQNERLEARLSGDGSLGEDWKIEDAQYLFYMSYRSTYAEEYFKRISPDALMRCMFSNANTNRYGDNKIKFTLLDTTKTKDFTSFFENAFSGIGFPPAERADLSTLYVGAATNMTKMFYGSSGFADPDLSAWDVSNVTMMTSMFGANSNLRSPNFSGWNTSNVTDMSNMFGNAQTNRNRQCKVLDISSFDTSSVTTMSGMFSNLQVVENIIFGEKFDVSSVKSFISMFSGCENLTSLDVSAWDTRSATSLGSMFANCKKLEEIDVSGFNTSNVTSATSVFSNCTRLKRVDMSGWDTSNIDDMYSMFSGCKSLSEIIGYSGTKKAGVRVLFPYGSSASDPYSLKRLTFRTDVENAIRYSINIQHNRFDRVGLNEMFQTLPDVSEQGLSSSYTKITITGNPAVLDEIVLAKTSFTGYSDYEDLRLFADLRYRGFSYQNAPIQYYLKGQSSSDAVTGVFSDITEDMFAAGYIYVLFLADSILVPDEMKLTDEDRAIAVSRGWQLTEK